MHAKRRGGHRRIRDGKRSKEKVIRSGEFVELQTLNFEDLYIPDMPRAAQICFSLCSIRRRKGKAEEHCAIAWANLRLFTRNDRLLDRATHLNLWPFPHGFEGYLNPLGHNGSNPNWDRLLVERRFR